MTSALRPCVAVASDQLLVASVVAAALSGKGLGCSVLAWPSGPDVAEEDESARDSVCEVTAAAIDVGLMISDFDGVTRIRSGVRLMSDLPVRWVVLTGAPRGPLWGALLEVGSWHVAPASVGLDEVTEILQAVSDGATITTGADRAELLESWRAVLSGHEELVARLATMTPREKEVLQLLYSGSPVRSIAQHFDVAEATVRTQVKRVLRKLDVRSQLAAVAAFEHARRVETAADRTDLVVSKMWLGRQLPAIARSPP